MITFQKELFVKIMPELPELFMPHYDEVALNKDVVKLDPDWQRYLQMELMGILHVMTVRDGSKLIGYFMTAVMPHLHYKQTITSISDIFFLLPEYRETGDGLLSTGDRLFIETDKMLEELKTVRSNIVTKVHLPINIIMKRRGYRHTENVWSRIF